MVIYNCIRGVTMQDVLDFDFNIKEIFLVHKSTFDDDNKMTMYKKRRNMSGFVYCISGRGEFNFGNFICYLEPGEIMFLSPDCSYTAKRFGNKEFLHITVNFDMDIPEISTDSVLKDILRGNGVGNMKTSDTVHLSDLMEKLEGIWKSKPLGYKLSAKSLVYEILGEYFVSVIRSYRKDTGYSKIYAAKKYIDENYTQDISISVLANMCYMSETHFRRVFLKLMGITPTEYKTNKRILKAKDLLLTGDYTVAEAAASVGIDDANYFSRIFKKKTGFSPTEYINMYGLS